MFSVRILGVILLLAGGLKIATVWEGGISRGVEASGMIGFAEAAIGCWMLSGLVSRAAARVGIATFLLFAGASLIQAIYGKASCGCFPGLLVISPWVMAVFDLLAVQWLWLESNWEKRLRPPLGQIAVGLGLVVIGSVLGSFTTRLASTKPVVRGGSEIWLGVSLHAVIPGFEAIQKGSEQFVFLHRTGCPLCHQALEEYRDLGLRSGDRWQFLIAEVPDDFGKHETASAAAVAGFRQMKLHQGFHWDITTPQFLHAKEGVVIAASTSIEEISRFIEERSISETGKFLP